MCDPTIACPVRSYFEDKVLGMAEYIAQNDKRAKQNRGADYTVPVAGLQLDPTDPYTFRVRLNQSYPQLRYLMVMTFTTPIPHEAAERYGQALSRHPVGCGPYLLAEWTPRERIVLKVNPNR